METVGLYRLWVVRGGVHGVPAAADEGGADHHFILRQLLVQHPEINEVLKFNISSVLVRQAAVAGLFIFVTVFGVEACDIITHRPQTHCFPFDSKKRISRK